jgi:hypothetical protein
VSGKNTAHGKMMRKTSFMASSNHHATSARKPNHGCCTVTWETGMTDSIHTLSGAERWCKMNVVLAAD